MCGQVMANLDCSVNYSSWKDHVCKAVVNKTSGRTRRAPVTKSDQFQRQSYCPKASNVKGLNNFQRFMTMNDEHVF